MNSLLIALIILATASAVNLLWSASRRRLATQLVDASVEVDSRFVQFDEGREPWLVRWLSRAGYRSPSALSLYLGATLGSTALGLAGIFLLRKLGIVDAMVETLSLIPGGVGDVMAGVAMAGPYIILAFLASAPTLIVRAARRARVEAIEHDLAPMLELLATLAEAGLSLDSAIARVQESESSERPLSEEFRIYQRDTLGGIPRLESLRRLARRSDITSLSIFISALIQSEQVGASLAETLRTQADDLRDRRKLRALLLAQALPVKLVFPLIFCFLPGIFYSTLGPVINQFVDVADSVLRRN